MKKHGDLYSDGGPPFYYCGKCTMNHAVENAHCDGLREKPVNGTFSWERPLVPTGVVPRVDHYAEALERGKRVGALIDGINQQARSGDHYTATAPLALKSNEGLGVGGEAPGWIGEALRQRYGLRKPKRYPLVGDVVEVDGVIGICTEYHKGWCYVRQLNDDAPWLDFISDEGRHGPCGKVWRIRDDL